MVCSPKQQKEAVVWAAAITLAVATVVLNGCGGGGKPDGPDPGPIVKKDCTDLMKRGHCTECEGNKVKTICKACSGNYTLDANATSPELFCKFDCAGFVPSRQPDKPANAMALNGVEWPSVCIDESVTRFFTIGDWGGVCGWGKDNVCLPERKSYVCICGADCGDKGKPCPMPNKVPGAANHQIDGIAQRLVSERMLARQKNLKEEGRPARFIINVGDNFYPGGIDFHCGLEDKSATSTQFQQIWKDMYREDLRDLEWWSVLGNHDYGGVCYIKGWDQQIFFTWHDNKWVMPGQYWRRSVQYANFKADFFFVDGNVFDTNPGDQGHDLCSSLSNPGKHCEASIYPGPGASCGASGPQTQPECKAWFNKLWEDNYKWLKAVVYASDAEWQFVVNHYPATYALGQAGVSYMDWSKFLDPMGVDLYISGHSHEQTVHYGAEKDYDFGKSAWVITGGGGGITTMGAPDTEGEDDQYGFMEVALSLNQLNITAYSHGGINNRTIVRSHTSVAPVHRASTERLLELGILTEEDVQPIFFTDSQDVQPNFSPDAPSFMAVV